MTIRIKPDSTVPQDYFGRIPRTLEEAFGPNARHALNGDRDPLTVTERRSVISTVVVLTVLAVLVSFYSML